MPRNQNLLVVFIVIRLQHSQTWIWLFWKIISIFLTFDSNSFRINKLTCSIFSQKCISITMLVVLLCCICQFKLAIRRKGKLRTENNDSLYMASYCSRYLQSYIFSHQCTILHFR